KGGGTLSLGSASLTSNGDVKIAGTLNAGSGTLTLTKHFEVTGTFNAGTSTVVMTGANKEIRGNDITFYNLSIQGNTVGKVNIVVTGDLIVTSGRTLTMGSKKLTVQGSIAGGGTITANAPFMNRLTVASVTELDVDFSENVSLATSQN